MLQKLIKEIYSLRNKEKAKILQRFFKTSIGEYGEGDVFLGLTSQQIKDVSNKYWKTFNLKDIQKLINSKIHEHRVCALRILIKQYNKSQNKEEIFNFYLYNTKKINNWDLVDISSPNIVGDFLIDKPKDILYKLANSENLWEKRISVISTFAFIRKNQFKDTIKISKILLRDRHDLIHKAVGWMLREIGKRNQDLLRGFLKENYAYIPRTTLRYAIEKFSEQERKKWLEFKNRKL